MRFCRNKGHVLETLLTLRLVGADPCQVLMKLGVSRKGAGMDRANKPKEWGRLGGGLAQGIALCRGEGLGVCTV